ncbi:hypothetical protein HOLleu_15695 [Holothuria leucospilota]|uniref:Uncharacterized protein n=1 Tax=Holothuria leucospilota TaxID=206669 RepID=A0A9Q1HA41_HOLLE|nr:hypothetical protein HOLleu_15695 [Holothuria leucospilota]
MCSNNLQQIQHSATAPQGTVISENGIVKRSRKQFTRCYRVINLSFLESHNIRFGHTKERLKINFFTTNAININ